MVRLADDGAGFQPGVAVPGLGLKGMRERAVSPADFCVESAPGHGTTIELRLGAAA